MFPLSPTVPSLTKEKIGTSLYRIHKVKGRFESSAGQNWITVNTVCKSGCGTGGTTFCSVSAHHHQTDGFQKAFLNALSDPCPELENRLAAA